MNIAVIGTEEVGLSTAILLAYMNHFVVVVDDDIDRVNKLKSNTIQFYEPFMNDAMQVVNSGMSFTTNLTKAIETSDIVYFTSNKGYSKMEVCNIFAASVQKKFRLFVNKYHEKVGSTTEMDEAICQTTTNFTIAYENSFLNTGTLVTDTFYPKKIVIGTRDIQALEILRRIYAPIISKTIMLPDFIEPPKYPPLKVIWTDISSAEISYYGRQVIRAMKNGLISELTISAKKYGGNIDDIIDILDLD